MNSGRLQGHADGGQRWEGRPLRPLDWTISGPSASVCAGSGRCLDTMTLGSRVSQQQASGSCWGLGWGDTGKGEGLWQTLAGACRAPFSLLLLSCKYVDALIPPPSAAPWQD